MHHKYVVRDGESVWTGSTNWTDDSWARQENVIVTVDSPELAHAFTLDFEELWSDGDVEQQRLRRAAAGGRRRDAGAGRGSRPASARRSTHRIAKKIGHAEAACGSARR